MNNKKTFVKIITQSFYPDIVATGELLYELATKLACYDDLEVKVLTAQPSFVRKERLTKRELYNGIKIRRISISLFDKNKLTGKILNSWTFFFKVLLRLTFSKKVDWLLIPTSPPLLPLVGAYVKLLRGQKYIYLLHDVYPEIAAKLDYIKKDGIIYKIWDILSKISLKYADKIIVLSDDMKSGLLNWVKDIDEAKIEVIHNWADEENIKIIKKEENHFLDKFNIRDKFIVEYSGNMGRIHEFDTLLCAAKELKDEKDILFLFIGEGGKKPEIQRFVEKNKLNNIMILSYQERKDLSYSLGMADVHVLSLAKQYKHLAAPSKLYGILATGKPVMFIGESTCYITRMIEENNCGCHINIGDFETLIQKIMQLKKDKELSIHLGKNSRKLFEDKFTLNSISVQYANLFNQTTGILKVIENISANIDKEKVFEKNEKNKV